MSEISLYKEVGSWDSVNRFEEIGKIELSERQINELDTKGFLSVPIPEPLKPIDFTNRPHSLVANKLKYKNYAAIYKKDDNNKSALMGCMLVETK